MDIRLLFLLGLASLVAAESPACNLCLNDVCHEKTRLLHNDTVSNTNSLVIDRPGKTLYYTDRDNAVYSFNLEDETSQRIIPKQIFHKKRALAVDEQTRDLFIGHGHHILKYSPVTNHKSVYISGTDIHVETLMFKDKLYVLGDAGHYNGTKATKLCTVEGHLLEVIEFLNRTFVSNFVVDKLGDIYFTKLLDQNFKLPARGNEVSTSFERRRFYYLTDKNDEMYFIDTDDKSVLKLDYSLGQFVKIGAGDSTVFPSFYSTIFFDQNNNLVFEDLDPNTGNFELFYLAPSSQRCRFTGSTIEKIERNNI